MAFIHEFFFLFFSFFFPGNLSRIPLGKPSEIDSGIASKIPPGFFQGTCEKILLKFHQEFIFIDYTKSFYWGPSRNFTRNFFQEFKNSFQDSFNNFMRASSRSFLWDFSGIISGIRPVNPSGYPPKTSSGIIFFTYLFIVNFN